MEYPREMKVNVKVEDNPILQGREIPVSLQDCIDEMNKRYVFLSDEGKEFLQELEDYGDFMKLTQLDFDRYLKYRRQARSNELEASVVVYRRIEEK